WRAACISSPDRAGGIHTFKKPSVAITAARRQGGGRAVQGAGMSTGHAHEVDTIKLPLDVRPFTGRSYGLSDRGQLRASNEDQFLIAELAQAMRTQATNMPRPRTQFSQDRSHLFIVADGMGGHNAGEEASAVAIESVADFLLNKLKWLVQRHALDRGSL